jgi:GH18 family chitinase
MWSSKSNLGVASIVACLFVVQSAIGRRVAADTSSSNSDNQFVIAGYLPDYRLPVLTEMLEVMNKTESSQSTTIADLLPLTDLFLFSLQPHSRGFLGGCCLNDEHYSLARELRGYKSMLNVWVTLGGAGRTDAFIEICSDEKRTTRLIEAVIKLCTKQGIQGVDLDFFRPTSVPELQSYVRFLQTATARWHEAGLMVSMTIFPEQKLPHAELYNGLDRINLMAYDMVGTGNGSGGNTHHASLEKVQQVVSILLEPGGGLDTQPNKIILGIPMYGRHQTNPGDVKTFYEIYDGIAADDDQEGSYSNDDSRSNWKGYEWDSPTAIRDKIIFAKERNLGGVFFWEIGQDKRTDINPMGMLLESTASAAGPTSPSLNSKDRKEEL